MAGSMPTGSSGDVDVLERNQDEDYDPPPLEYARINGLCRNFLRDSFAFVHVSGLQAATSYRLNDSHLPQLDLGVGPSISERLVLSQDGARFLRSIKEEETFKEIESLVLPMLASKDVATSKVELPLLKSDHKTDCKDFTRREDFEIRFKDVKLPSEIIDEANGEGLLPSRRYRQSEQQIKHGLEVEKIEISRAAVAYLQMAVKDSWTQEDEEELWGREHTCKRLTVLEPVTPPRSPLYPPPRQYKPTSSSPTYQLPVLSDPESLSKEDLKNIEDYIFKQDIPTPIRNSVQNIQKNHDSSATSLGDSTVNLADIYSPAKFMGSSTPPSAQSERIRREDLKIEEPLTPLKPIAEKKVKFSEGVEHMLLDVIPTEDPEEYDRFFVEATFGTDYKSAMQQAEQEKLIEADTTARVDERVMDFSTPEPPWKKFELVRGPPELLSLQSQMVKSVVESHLEIWKRPTRKQLDLRWNPFPHDLAKIALQESYGPDPQAWKIFVSLEDKQEIDSSDLTWKPPGLRIMKINDEDDEIEPRAFSSDQQKDMTLLVRERKQEIERDGLGDENSKKSQSQAQLRLQNNGSQGGSKIKGDIENLERSLPVLREAQSDIESNSYLLLGGGFSAGSLLENYKELRGAKKRKHGDNPISQGKNLSARPEPAPTISNSPRNELQIPIRHSPIRKANYLPVPPLKVLTRIIKILVSTALLKRRSLVRHLEALLPTLTLVERDFTTHNTTAWMAGSVTRSPIRSPLDSEADLIVSPSTGIMLTTLQKVKQVPLPGSKAKTAIRDRLEKTALRYDKLIVLVTEGRSDETTNGLDENDCIGLSEFIGFASGHATQVTVHFVAGGEEVLAKWLASTVVQYSLGEVEFDLLSEETHWELFLRRAGMNAFAAQAIVADLKAPEGVDTSSPSKVGQFGIAAFVEMGREQRLRRFEGLCGRGLVQRVSSVVDRRWE